MYLKTVTILFCLTCQIVVFSQGKVHYTLKADANALMCPFLSPQLMERLAQNGAVEVYKDSLIQLHFSTLKEKEFSDDFILKLVDDTGYQPKLFTILRKYED